MLFLYTQCPSSVYGELLPAPADTYGGQDLTEIELAHHERAQKPAAIEVPPPPQIPRTGSESGGSSSGIVVDSEPAAAPEIPESKLDLDGQTARLVNLRLNRGDGDGEGEDDKFEDAKSERDDGDAAKPDDMKSDKAEDGDAPPSNPVLTGPGGVYAGPRGPVHEGWRCDACGVSRTFLLIVGNAMLRLWDRQTRSLERGITALG